MIAYDEAFVCFAVCFVGLFDSPLTPFGLTQSHSPPSCTNNAFVVYHERGERSERSRMVPPAGIEPACPGKGQGILSPPCLPFHHGGRDDPEYSSTTALSTLDRQHLDLHLRMFGPVLMFPNGQRLRADRVDFRCRDDQASQRRANGGACHERA